MCPRPHADSLWRTTRVSVLERARGPGVGQGRDAAWQQLIADYRRPIRVCLERRVRRHPDRDAIVDEFFTYLFTADVLSKLDPARGRFRAFLQEVMRRYVLGKVREYERRGDDAGLERLLEVDPPSGTEVEEERTWARSILDRAVAELLTQRGRDGRMLLQYYGIHPYTPRNSATLADENGLSVEAVHKALSRARKQLQQLLEAQVAQLVDGTEDYESEKAALIGRLLEAQPGLLG